MTNFTYLVQHSILSVINDIFEMSDPNSQGIESRCLYFHRTAVIMADGEVVSCANFYAESMGRIDQNTTLWDVWNGERMVSLRSSFGTTEEWEQCRTCWFREVRYYSQRRSWANKGDVVKVHVNEPVGYQKKSWDFRRFISAEEAGRGADES